MASITICTLEEYLATVYEPDCEYIEGEIVERNMGESDHAGLQGLIVAWLFTRRREFGIHVFPEMRVQVSPRRFRVPDITVTTKRVRGRILTEPPLLCIEILSPEDRASRLEDKVDDYLKFGVSHIWVIDPRAKRAWSYVAGGKRDAATVLTTLSGPRIELPVMELFRELDDEVEPES
jgi:Uma2 family endonuclease